MKLENLLSKAIHKNAKTDNAKIDDSFNSTSSRDGTAAYDTTLSIISEKPTNEEDLSDDALIFKNIIQGYQLNNNNKSQLPTINEECEPKMN